VEYLFLVGNKKSEIPAEVNEMKRLRFLDLSDNPLAPLLDERVLDPKVIIRLNRKN
jgi:Leucine-rich repeat (LRR) protein